MPKLNPEQQAARRSRLLDAAERCFTRRGFHTTTMQDICGEAGVSAGAIYVYFRSKEDLIAGLAERDRAELAADFTEIDAADDFIGTLARLGRKHLIEMPRERDVLALSIWAEASRDPAMQRLCEGFEKEVFEMLRALFVRAQQAGSIAPQIAIEPLISLLMTLADGMIKQRVLSRSFDGEKALALLMDVLDAGLRGAIRLDQSESRPLETT